MQLKRILRPLVGMLVHALLQALPARQQAFVFGWPPDEGNAVEVVRALARRYAGDIYWADRPSDDRLCALDLDPKRIVGRKKRTVSALLAFLRAEVTFFTHGVYGHPRPAAGKTLVNLWHGDGPKTHSGGAVPATYLVSGSKVFGHYRATHSGTESGGLIFCGMPRIQQFQRPTAPAQLQAMGIDPMRPFVVWLPTWRQGSAPQINTSWTDTSDRASDLNLAAAFAPGAALLARRGIQLLAKPHPMDLVSRRFSEFTFITDTGLDEVGTTLYCLLGASAGLITDYSSVWTDYLATDRPIGFFMPDLNAYLTGRGLYPPDWGDHLPGTRLVDAGDFIRFGDEVLGTTRQPGGTLREEARRFFEISQSVEPADDLLTVLGERGVLAVSSEEE